MPNRSTASEPPSKPPIDIEGYLAPGSTAEKLFHQLDLEALPASVAIIMDGNGRWAKERHFPRVIGHEAGIESVREAVETSARLRLDALTLYAFSVENWKRPPMEISTLWVLLKRYLRRELNTLLDNDIRFRGIGRLEGLPKSVRTEIDRCTEKTADNHGMLFQVALNYGGRAEIVDACRRIVDDVRQGKELVVDEELIARYLYTDGAPDPDLLIRTSGELRISNFLLWQIAYSEIWVTDTLWPEFRREHFLQALLDYQSRERRYGGVAAR